MIFGMHRPISVISYDPQWPILFAEEARLIRSALGAFCHAVHHVGSTAVAGLAAKPKIDIIMESDSPEACISLLENAGYVFKGEYNLPLHFGFSKRGPQDYNLHLYETGHAEVELNLTFRDYLREHPEARAEYEQIKLHLAALPSTSDKTSTGRTYYNRGKDPFIRKVLNASGFERLRVVRCVHTAELEAAEAFRQRLGATEPAAFGDPAQAHLLLTRGVEPVGYAYVSDQKVSSDRIQLLHAEPEDREWFVRYVNRWLEIKQRCNLRVTK